MELVVENLKKVFNRRVIFRNLSVRVSKGETLLISGPNGSGKSTLAKILSGVLTPSTGSVALIADGARYAGVPHSFLGHVSPYLQLYDEFSPLENLEFALAVRGVRPVQSDARTILAAVGLEGRMEDTVRTFSSGMKQRVKYAFALVHRPAILILDEPMANLDEQGISLVRGIMNRHRSGGILVVATNDPSDVEQYEHRVDLGTS